MSPKIFPVVVRRTTAAPAPSAGGVVERDRIVVESVERAPVPADAATFELLARAEEVAPDPLEVVVLLAAVAELVPDAVDVASAVVRIVVGEAPPAPSEALQLSARVGDAHPPPIDATRLVAAVSEIAPDPVEAASAVVRSITSEEAPPPVDLPLLGPQVAEVAPVAVDTDASGRVRVFTGANDRVEDLGGTGALVNDANTFGVKDGLTGSVADTSSTGAQNKTVRWLFPDLNASVQSFAIASVVLRQFTRWVPGLNAATITIEYQTGDGTWRAFEPRPAGSLTANWDVLADGFALDVSDVVAGDWAKVNGLQVRATLVDTITLGAGTGTLTIDAFELIVTTQDKAL